MMIIVVIIINNWDGKYSGSRSHFCDVWPPARSSDTLCKLKFSFIHSFIICNHLLFAAVVDSEKDPNVRKTTGTCPLGCAYGRKTLWSTFLGALLVGKTANWCPTANNRSPSLLFFRPCPSNILSPPVLCRVAGELKPVPADTGRGHQFITGLLYRDNQPFTLVSHLHAILSHQWICMSLGCARKPEYPERTHADTGEGENIQTPHRKNLPLLNIKLRTFLLEAQC